MENTTLTLTPAQIEIIQNALLAVERSGGGSPEFHLRGYIERETGTTACPERATRYQQIARSELELE